MKFFKPEDFYKDECIHCVEDGFRIAALANAQLEREGKVVYGNELHWTLKQYSSDTRKALLINIEPVEKCAHPESKISRASIDWESLRIIKDKEAFVRAIQYYCMNDFRCECGARVKPKEFEEVK